MQTVEEQLAAVAAQRLALQAEYGQYVCKDDGPIFINGARAFNPGDPVPASHVEKFDLADQVDKVKNPPKVTQAAIKAEVENKKDGA